jgi:hypothetical protein
MRIIVALSLLGLGACDGDDNNGTGPVEQAITIQTISLAGTATEAGTVTVDQQADADGTADTSWSATFTLEERRAPVSLPLDDGTARTHTIDVKTVPTGAGDVGRTRVRIAIGE